MATFAQGGRTVHSVVSIHLSRYTVCQVESSSCKIFIIALALMETFAQGGLTVRLVVKTKLTANSLSYSILIDY